MVVVELGGRDGVVDGLGHRRRRRNRDHQRDGRRQNRSLDHHRARGPPPPPPAGSEVLVGAGDIASCSSSGDDATANLLDGISGTVFTLGDNAYPNGSSSDYANCYGPSWGRHKARTMPSPGNHEYQTAGAAGYFAYFGSAAGTRPGLLQLQPWRLAHHRPEQQLELRAISCAAGSAQEQWLRADLAANTKACTLAYWHHPRFNSGQEHGNNYGVAPFWDALYDVQRRVILNGHEHVYERFAPQTPNAVAGSGEGIRQFTVGTGGASLYSFKATPEPNSEGETARRMGVLKLTLQAERVRLAVHPGRRRNVHRLRFGDLPLTELRRA